MDQIVSIVTDIVNQLTGAPSGVLVVVGTIAVGYMLKLVKRFPNDLIPVATFVVSVAGMIFIGETGLVDGKNVRHPEVRLGFTGVATWLIAWLIHAQVLSRLEDKLGLFSKPAQPESPANSGSPDPK